MKCVADSKDSPELKALFEEGRENDIKLAARRDFLKAQAKKLSDESKENSKIWQKKVAALAVEKGWITEKEANKSEIHISEEGQLWVEDRNSHDDCRCPACMIRKILEM